jgi:hypothetical protein
MSAVAGASTTAATKPIVLRPGTSTGNVSKAYRQKADHHSGPVDCSPPEASSPVAVDPGSYFCSPSAAYAVACWPAASSGQVLCYRDPFRREVDNVYGSAAHRAPRLQKPAGPFGIVLDHGVKGTIRCSRRRRSGQPSRSST